VSKYYVHAVFTVELSTEVEADSKDTALFRTWSILSSLLDEMKKEGKKVGVTVRTKSKDTDVWEC